MTHLRPSERAKLRRLLDVNAQMRRTRIATARRVFCVRLAVLALLLAAIACVWA